MIGYTSAFYILPFGQQGCSLPKREAVRLSFSLLDNDYPFGTLLSQPYTNPQMCENLIHYPSEEFPCRFKIKIEPQKSYFIRISIPLLSKYYPQEMKTCMHFAYVLWQLHHHPVRCMLFRAQNAHEHCFHDEQREKFCNIRTRTSTIYYSTGTLFNC